MKFSENWLRTFVNPPLSSRELADALTMGGIEVEALEPAAPPFDRVVVGEVLKVEKHPGADRLTVCEVSTGGPTLTIVCGAPNVRQGIKVPVALVGARRPGGYRHPHIARSRRPVADDEADTHPWRLPEHPGHGARSGGDHWREHENCSCRPGAACHRRHA